ncbi:MAG: hypothetical protein LBV33_01115 [Lachnospiraceae bacterium]|jgi:hypothetical protein|nr:hypothetical protein [Lachnospiraceae bacterium]
MSKRKSKKTLKVHIIDHKKCDGNDYLPTIGENGNWFTGGEDTGVAAKGEPGPQGPPGGVQVPALISPINKTIDISELQNEIDALPRLLLADVTFNVNPGTYDQPILIERFTGTGMLNIIGADVKGQLTHNIVNMIIRYCSIMSVKVQGFNAVGTSNSIFSIANCTKVILQYCSAMDGTSSTAMFHGVGIDDGYAVVFECEFSNKNCAVRAGRGSRVIVYNTSGSNNYYAYSAYHAGIIQKEEDGTLNGTQADLCGLGGIIVSKAGVIM